MKRKSVDGEGFLDFLIQATPEAALPPFFAPRVGAVARSQAAPFELLLSQLAKRLLPSFAALGVVVLLVVYHASSVTPVAPYSELLIDQEQTEDVITLDFVLDSLRP